MNRISSYSIPNRKFKIVIMARSSFIPVITRTLLIYLIYRMGGTCQTTKTALEGVLAKTIVTISSNEFPRFPRFIKDVNRSGKLCIPLWSFEEISDCREGIFSDLSKDMVSALFDKAGGVPRSVLLKPSMENDSGPLLRLG